MALLIDRRAWVLVVATTSGCFGATVDPAGHPCEVDADCALGDGLVCDPAAGVCAPAGDDAGETTGASAASDEAGSTPASSGEPPGEDSGTSAVGPTSSGGPDDTGPATDTGDSTGPAAMLVIDALVPDKGRTDIMRDVVLVGGGFRAGVGVFFDDVAAEVLSVEVEAVTVRVPAAAGVTGPVDVRVELGDDVVDLPGAYRRISGMPTFAPLPSVDIVDQGSVPAAFDIVAGSFGGSGTFDIAFGSSNVADRLMMVEGDGAGGFSVAYDHPDGVLAIEAGDMDEDGLLDLVVVSPYGVRVYRNDGFSNFLIQPYPGQMPFARGLAVLDLDHVDGPDLVVRAAFDFGIQTWINDGSGGLLAQQTWAASAMNSVDWAVHPSVADFDGDGWEDVLTPCEPPNTPSGFALFRNDGAGGLEAPTFVSLGTNGTDSVVLQANPGTDMIPDAVGLTYNTGIYGLLGNGDGTFASNQVTNTAPSGVLRVRAGDFNCDDAPDLAIADGLGSFVIDRGSPGGSFSPAGGQTFAMDGINRGLVVGDVDDDGLPDVVVAHHTSTGVLQLFVYRNTSGDP